MMKKQIVTILILVVTLTQSAVAADFFTSADQFFSKYVENGAVNYAEIKSNASDLKNLLNQIASYDLESVDANTQKAFMINTYNILAIQGIIAKYPSKGPMSINNFFDNKIYTVAGKKMSLNSLEKGRLYPFANDPRLHFVLVCAAQSCPKLASFAFTADKLEQQLESQTKSVLNDPEFIRKNKGKLQISEIFNWYGRDFTKTGKTVLEYINGYLKEKVPAKTKTSFYTYSWNLNDSE